MTLLVVNADRFGRSGCLVTKFIAFSSRGHAESYVQFHRELETINGVSEINYLQIASSARKYERDTGRDMMGARLSLQIAAFVGSLDYGKTQMENKLIGNYTHMGQFRHNFRVQICLVFRFMFDERSKRSGGIRDGGPSPK